MALVRQMAISLRRLMYLEVYCLYSAMSLIR